MKSFQKTVIVFFLFLVALLYLRSTWNITYIGCFGDDASYILLAKALAIGKGYVSLHYPGNPPHRDYLSGFPVFITPFIILVNETFYNLKWINTIITLGILFLSYLLFKSYLTNLLTGILLFFMLTNNLLLTYSSSVMSDPLFTLLSLTYIFLLNHYETKNNKQINLARAIGIALMLCVTIRAVGLALLIPLIALAIQKRDHKLFIFGSLPLTGILITAHFYGWFKFYQVKHLGTPFILKLEVIRNNIPFYLQELLRIIIGEYPMQLSFYGWRVLFWLLFVLIVIGVIQHLKRYSKTWVFYFFPYVIVLMAFKLRDSRLLFPILPFVYYFLFQGILSFFPKLKIISGAIIAVLFFTTIKGMLWFFPNMIWSSHLMNTPDPALQWIKEHTEQNAVIQSILPSTCYMYTNRTSMPFKKEMERYEIMELLANNKVNYIYFSNVPINSEATGDDYLGLNDYRTAIQEDTHRFRLIYHDQRRNSLIYKVLLSPENYKKAMEETREGAKFYHQGKYKEAVEKFQTALTLASDFYLPANFLGLTLVELGKKEEGIKILRKNIELYPSIERGYTALAYVYTKEGRDKEALTLLQKAISLAQHQKHHPISIEIQQEIDKLKMKK